MLNPDEVAATRKANLDLFFGLSSAAVEGIGKLAALNGRRSGTRRPTRLIWRRSHSR